MALSMELAHARSQSSWPAPTTFAKNGFDSWVNAQQA